MFRKALLPILLIVAAALLLMTAAYLYEKKWPDGPFQDSHHGHQH